MYIDADFAMLTRNNSDDTVLGVLRTSLGYRVALLDQDYNGWWILKKYQTDPKTLKDCFDHIVDKVYQTQARVWGKVIPSPREQKEVEFFQTSSVQACLQDYAWAVESAQQPEIKGEPGYKQGGLVYRDLSTGQLSRRDGKPARSIVQISIQKENVEHGIKNDPIFDRMGKEHFVRTGAIDEPLDEVVITSDINQTQWYCVAGCEIKKICVNVHKGPEGSSTDKKTYVNNFLHEHERNSEIFQGSTILIQDSFVKTWNTRGQLVEQTDTSWKHSERENVQFSTNDNQPEPEETLSFKR